MFLKTLTHAALAAVVLTSAAQAADITGAGATFPFPVYSKWADAYKKETGNGLNYQSIGSGAGIKQIQAKTVTFGASDIPLTPEDLKKDGLVQWPMVMGGIVPVVNVEGVKPGGIVLDGPTLADIFLGKVKKWDDAEIKKLNPGVTLPSTGITVVRRSDGSARPSTSRIISQRSARSGRARSVLMPPSSGRWASAPAATTASPATSARPRTRSATSSTPTPSRTS